MLVCCYVDVIILRVFMLFNLLVCRGVGELMCTYARMLVGRCDWWSWCVGVCFMLCVGVLVCWCVDVLVCASCCVLVCWFVGVLVRLYVVVFAC